MWGRDRFSGAGQRHRYRENADVFTLVKTGITALWRVSGRNGRGGEFEFGLTFGVFGTGSCGLIL